MRMAIPTVWVAMALASIAIGCGSGDGGAGDASVPTPDARVGPPPDPIDDSTRDLAGVDLTVDVTARTATARISFEPLSVESGITLEIGDMDITAVRDDQGDLNFEDRGDDMIVGLFPDAQTIEIDYTYSNHVMFDGAIENGLTFLWPYHCGNLFPCKSDPDDGLTFELELTGVPAGDTAVYPTAISEDAPSYMLAWAIGDYQSMALGATTAGTNVSIYYLPGEQNQMVSGTTNLVGVFDWFEQNLGPYLYGSEVASVSAPWGPGAFGGMEHHPLWHVGTGSIGDQETHAHEAAHGWFGNGIRIACWEDFVLSEGVVSYLAARGLEEIAGQNISDPIWAGYRQGLSNSQIAWPIGCNEIDIIDDGLFSSAPYVKGAWFLRRLEERIGRVDFDVALSGFYSDNRGDAMRMQDLLDRFQTVSGYDPTACADKWLRNAAVPAVEQCQ